MTRQQFIDSFDLLYELLSAFIYDKYMQSDQYIRGLLLDQDARSFIVEDMAEEYKDLGILKIEFRIREAKPYIKYKYILTVDYYMSITGISDGVYTYRDKLYALLDSFNKVSNGFQRYKLYTLQEKYDMDILVLYKWEVGL